MVQLRRSVPPPADEAEFRKYPPPPDEDVYFSAPRIHETRLSNGLRVLWAERNEMPIVAMQVVVNRGLELQSAPGVASMTATMMTMGTQSKSALVLSDELEAMGAIHGTWTDYDGMGVRGQALQEQFPELLAILADIARRPAFGESDFERERAKRLSTLAALADTPETLLEDAIEERLYPEGHPFHAPILGNEKSIRTLQSADLARQHALAFRPMHATVAIAGAIEHDAAIALVEKHFGDWTGELVPRIPALEVSRLQPGEKRILLMDRPGSAQSNVALGVVGIARKSPDYDAAMVLNVLLGGQFSSRLNLNLREKYAYTYGAYSVVEPRSLPGPWTAGGAMTTTATAAAIREIFGEIERLQNELVPEDELHHAKTNLIRKLPARFETAAGTAHALGSLAVLDLPLDVFSLRQARAAAVKAEDIRRVALTYLRPEAMRVFVVGDAAAIRGDLEKLGLGEVELRQTDAEMDSSSSPADACGRHG